MKNIYLGIAVVVALSSWSTPVVLAAVDISLPVSDPGNWYKAIGSKYHIGKSEYAIDFNRVDGSSADTGKPVFAVAAGTVSLAYNSPGSGGLVNIDHADNLRSAYHHLDFTTLKVGVDDPVTQGQLIGYIASNTNNGYRASTSHLHFAVYKVASNGFESAYNLDNIPAFKSVIERKLTNYETIRTIQTEIPDWSPAGPLGPIVLQPITDMVNEFYQWALSIGTGVASGIVIYGGVLYILSVGNPSKQTEAKEWIKSAIYGLLLLLLSYLLLFTINPSLVGGG